MLDEVLNTTRIFGIIVCERENVAADEIHLEHPFGVATAGLIRVSKKHDDGTFVLPSRNQEVKIRVFEMPLSESLKLKEWNLSAMILPIKFI